MTWESLFIFMLRKVQCLRNCFCYLRITWRSVILLMCLALRIVVRNSKGNIWKSIWRMTVQIGPSLAPSVRMRFCGIAWRFVAALDLLCFGLERSDTFSSYFQYTWFGKEYGHCETQIAHEQRWSESRKHLHAAAVKTEVIKVDRWMRVETVAIFCSAGLFCIRWEVEVQRS